MEIIRNTSSGKTSRVRSQAENRREETSMQSSNPLLKLPTPAFMYLNLRKEKTGDTSGNQQDQWLVMDSVSRGELWMLSFGEFRSEENEFSCVLNIEEYPTPPVPSRLSDILMSEVPEKYCLSVRACEGILRRSSERGKKLPEILQTALERQIDRGSCSGKSPA